MVADEYGSGCRPHGEYSGIVDECAAFQYALEMQTRTIEYTDAHGAYEGFVAVPAGDGRRPAVMVCHAWEGQDDFAREEAERLAGMGYVGFAADVYGKGRRAPAGDKDAAGALMTPLVEDRALLADRLKTSLDAMKAQPEVDPDRCAAIGFCFGGLCVLDMARKNMSVRGVVSVHGLFFPSEIPTSPIRPKVLALHGYDDPMATPDLLVAFGKEMTDAHADWQVHAYGGTMHAFTSPAANDPGFGVRYSADADRRARAAMRGFLEELFG
jgi:dienelactone hydrolase